MSDYPPERIICDIVELLQDLKAQGYLIKFEEYTTGAIDVYLFANKSEHNSWLDSKCNPTYKRSVYSYPESNWKYAQELLDTYNELHDFKDLTDHHAAVEKMLCDREYIIENLTERAA
jgi:hypothetical protein